jgi:hypothetical protein
VAAPESVRPRRRGAVRLLFWSPAVLCAALALALGGWMLTGGRVLVMQTPSMGTAAPAGSLVLVRSLGDTALHRGMIVAFHVPETGALYMHRIAQILPGGKIRTRGDLNGADDGWALTRAALVGVPALIVPGVGWLLLAAPWALGVLAFGGLLALVLPRSARPTLRSLSIGVAISLPLYILRPFTRVAVVAAGHSHTRFVAKLVNAGLFPLRVTLRGAQIVIAPAHAGTIAAPIAGHSSTMLAAHADVPLWGWLLICGFVAAPLVGAMRGLRRGPASTPAERVPSAVAASRNVPSYWLNGPLPRPITGMG